MSDDISGLQVSIDEMQKTLERVLASMDAIKNTARSTLSSASLILALVSLLQILAPTVQVRWVTLYGFGLALVAVLYLVLIGLCVYSLAPVSMIGPVAPEWQALRDAFTGKCEQDILLTRLGGLINAIHQNRPIVQKYSRMVTLASSLLPALVLLLLLLALIPRI
jgi:hypothetical protein